ncbi:hypothetical protein [Carp edema virus]|nr:hypothetical protein [Carp edema virus]
MTPSIVSKAVSKINAIRKVAQSESRNVKYIELDEESGRETESINERSDVRINESVAEARDRKDKEIKDEEYKNNCKCFCAIMSLKVGIIIAVAILLAYKLTQDNTEDTPVVLVAGHSYYEVTYSTGDDGQQLVNRIPVNGVPLTPHDGVVMQVITITNKPKTTTGIVIDSTKEHRHNSTHHHGTKTHVTHHKHHHTSTQTSTEPSTTSTPKVSKHKVTKKDSAHSHATHRHRQNSSRRNWTSTKSPMTTEEGSGSGDFTDAE